MNRNRKKNKKFDNLNKLNPVSLDKNLTIEQKNNFKIINIINTVEKFLKININIEPIHKIVVAMSGGVDSTVLFDVLYLLSKKIGYSLCILHFNHKLRGLNSEKDQELVIKYANDYNVPYYTASGNVKQFAEKNSLSIEFAARQLRYNFYEKISRTIDANFVATAHTLNDSAETFLINLIRGTGLTGLSGIPPIRNLIKNVQIIRPLLKFKKEELIEYANIRKLVWNEDESNSLLYYTRNKIRHTLIPLIEEQFNNKAIENIIKASNLINSAEKVISKIVLNSYEKLLEEGNQDKFIINIPVLKTFENFIQGEIIHFLCSKYFKMLPLNSNTIEKILELLNKQSGTVCDINSNYYVIKDRENLIFTKRQFKQPVKIKIVIPGKYTIGKMKIDFSIIDYKQVKFNTDPNIEYFDISLIDKILEIRNWEIGDYFQPLGLKNKVKLSDFLINEKVSILEKNDILVLTNFEDIIWVIGKRISEIYKVKKNSKQALKATINYK